MTDSELTLHEAADALGVHYMTAYRYVRMGLLDAVKVGGTWRVTAGDVDAFRASGTRSVGPIDRADADGDGARDSVRANANANANAGAGAGAGADAAPHGDGNSPAEDGGRRRAPWASRLEARLVAGDTRGAWSVIEAALAAGAGLEDIYADVMTPALQSIGDRWANGLLDVSIEHRASGIVMRLIGRLGPRFARRGRTRGVVVLGAPAGERHALSLAMAADVIRQQGWEVFDLGADVPADAFAHAVAHSGDVVAAGIAVSTAASVGSAGMTIAAIRGVAPSLPIILGGQAITDLEHALSLGADAHAAGLSDLAAHLTTIRNAPMAPVR